MPAKDAAPSGRVRDAIARRLIGLMASGAMPARAWRGLTTPTPQPLPADRRLTLEIVSHCWQYAPLLRFQLASLVRNPPTALDVRVRVFFSHDDPATERLLEAFAAYQPLGITWHWHALPMPQLMRRAIGRNLAAQESTADWLWFTDCDVLFGAGCLDALAETLRGQPAVLVHPDTEWTTGLLDEAALHEASAGMPLVGGPNLTFTPHPVTRATGPMQIVRGDVARALGYCAATPAFLAPAQHWCKTREDRVFRWLLGTQGQGLAIPEVRRIRHLSKGRYRTTTGLTPIRQRVRRAQDAWLRR